MLRNKIMLTELIGLCLSVLYSTAPAQDCIKEGQKFYNQNNFKQVVITVEKCKNLPESNTLLGDSYFALGYMEEAKYYLKKASEYSPKNIALKVKYVKAIALNKEFKKALEESKILATQYPGDTLVMKGYAEILGWNRLYDEAIKLYREVLKINPDDFNSKMQIATLLSWSKKFNEAIDAYNTIISQNPPREIKIQAMLYKAQVISWQKKLDESISSYMEIVKIEPKCVDAHIGIATILEWQSKFKDAKKQYETALNYTPENKILKAKLANLMWVK